MNGYTEWVVDVLSSLVSINSVNPRMGGPGEEEKGEYVKGVLEDMGYDIVSYDAYDPEYGPRPNFYAELPGQEGLVWITAHLDVVPPGDLGLWNSDPFVPKVEGTRVYGRGAEDNGHGIALNLLLARMYSEGVLTPRFTTRLLFVSDEEHGSAYGLKHLIDKGLFSGDDFAVVPDYGTPEGTFLEVAEKSILWLKFEVKGVQTHASTPHRGKNAHRIGMKLALDLDHILHHTFPTHDFLFDPPTSTFEPTRKEENVPNINTVPGKDVFYYDCRILPEYPVDTVLEVVSLLCDHYSRLYGVEVNVEVVQREDAAPPTPPEHPLVQKLSDAVRETRGTEPRVGGIGGGTVGGILRKAGVATVVWSTIYDTAHQPNEFADAENVVRDAETLSLFLS